MKTYSQYMESMMNQVGLSNHYSPVDNILTDIRNLYCTRLGIVAMKGEDDVSIKLTSSRFTSKENMSMLLNCMDPMDRRPSLRQYIMDYGLNNEVAINLGGPFWVMYYCPSDLAQKTCADDLPHKLPCPEECDSCHESEFEMTSDSVVIESYDDEEEMSDPNELNKNNEKIIKIVSQSGKIKAAKELNELVKGMMELPEEYYFAAVKFKDDDEAIALRWKHEKPMPHDKKASVVRSLIHIFSNEEGMDVFVQDFTKDSIVKLPEDVEALVKNILNLLGATETKEPGVYDLKANPADDKKDDEKKNKEDKSDDDDSEDDNSRGE